MESNILKHFVGMDVEVLVGGTWIEGHLLPIVKDVVVLKPFKEVLPFYGPTSMHAEAVQAIRQMIRNTPTTPEPPADPTVIRSGLDQSAVGKFVVVK